MSDLTIKDYIMDLRLNLNRLGGIVDEVEESIADGNLDGAALVLDSQTGKVGRFVDSYGALQKQLGEEGADAQRALEQSD